MNSPSENFNLPGNAHLDLTCRKCTRTDTFHAMTIPQAGQDAIESGWVRESDGTPQGGYFVCPQCPAVRVHVSPKGVTVAQGDHQSVLAQAEAIVEPQGSMLG